MSLKKLLFATKISLAITIAYMVPLALGWNQPNQGVVAIMVIAPFDFFKESISRGLKRVLGTVVGAVIGLILISLFPQDRFLYLFALSVVLGVVIYLHYSYEGDKTLFLIMVIVIVLLFDGSSVDNKFLYAIERAWSTAFGVFVYILISMLFPSQNSSLAIFKLKELISSWRGFLDGGSIFKLKKLEDSLRDSLKVEDTLYLNGVILDSKRLNAIFYLIQKIDLALIRLKIVGYLDEFNKVTKNIDSIIESILSFFEKPSKIKFKKIEIKAEDSISLEFKNLQDSLIELVKLLNRDYSFKPNLKEFLPLKQKRETTLFNQDALVSTFISLLIFWSGLFLWIYFNLPFGYMVSSMALVLSLSIVFQPINPLVLIVIFTISLIFSFIGYVFILPRLTTPYELAFYIFLYSFLIYYFIPVELSLFFALGLTFEFIDNSMVFDFRLFMIVLVIFYLFLGLLLFFHYIPFANRPEKMFLMYKNRFWKQLKSKRVVSIAKSLESMALWIEAIDYKYFNRVDKKLLISYIEILEKIVTLLWLQKNSLDSIKIDKLLNQEIKRAKKIEEEIDFEQLKWSRF